MPHIISGTCGACLCGTWSKHYYYYYSIITAKLCTVGIAYTMLVEITVSARNIVPYIHKQIGRGIEVLRLFESNMDEGGYDPPTPRQEAIIMGRLLQEELKNCDGGRDRE